MKRIFRWLPIVLLLFLITGCVNFEYSMEIKEDKSVVIDVIYSMDKSEVESLNKDGEESTESQEEINKNEINIEDYKKLEEKGWRVENYTDTKDNKNFEGIKLSKTYPNIDNITKEKEKIVILSDLFDEDKEFDETQFFSGKDNNYKANFVFEFENKSNTTEETQRKDVEAESLDMDVSTPDMSATQNMFTLSYTVKLPVEAKNNNATTVSEDKKTLSWKLDTTKKNEINYEFTLSNKAVLGDSSLALYVVIGSIGLLLVLIIAALIKKGKTKSSQSTNQEVPVSTQAVESKPLVEQPPLVEEPIQVPVTEQPPENQNISN